MCPQLDNKQSGLQDHSVAYWHFHAETELLHREESGNVTTALLTSSSFGNQISAFEITNNVSFVFNLKLVGYPDGTDFFIAPPP